MSALEGKSFRILTGLPAEAPRAAALEVGESFVVSNRNRKNFQSRIHVLEEILGRRFKVETKTRRGEKIFRVRRTT